MSHAYAGIVWPYAIQQTPDSDDTRGPRRGGDSLASTHDPRRLHAEDRLRHVRLPAAGAEGHPEDQPNRPRGDERLRRPGSRPAVHPADGAVGRDGHGPAEGLRRDARLVRRPPWPRERPGPDGRGGHDAPRRHGDQELQAAADQPLPDQDEVPRRVPPAVRRAPQPRVPDEGRLQLPHEPREPRRDVPRDVRRVLPHLHALRRAVRDRRGPRPARWAARAATSSPSPARTART